MANYKPKYVKKVLITEKQVALGIKKAATWMNKKYANAKKPPVIVGILNGAVPFYGQLVTQLKFECLFDFMTLSSFRGQMKACSKPNIVTGLRTDIKNRDVIIVEDVVDRACTLKTVVKYLKTKQPKTVRTVVLVDKPNLRVTTFKPDFACFTLKGNPFIVGCGLDIKEKARNLPYIGEFDEKYLNKI